MTRSSVLALLAAALAPSAATAQLITYDGFNYPTGSSIHLQNGGTGWAAGWNTGTPGIFTAAAGSLTPPGIDLATTGNRLNVGTSGATVEYVIRPLSTDLATFGTVWLSFTISRVSGSGSFGGLVLGDASSLLFVGDLPDFENWGMQPTGGGAVAVSNFTLAQHPTALLVVRIDFAAGADTIRLYVNRPTGGNPPQSVDAILTSFDINPGGEPVDYVRLWSNSNTYQLDEIRIGTSYADVTPVPEPGAVLAVAAGALAAGAWLRRRTRFRRVAHAPPTAG